jgi:hypothetical protein
MADNDRELTLSPLDSEACPPSAACRAYCEQRGYDSEMPVFRAAVSPEFMLRGRADRPDVANYLQLLVGPYGIVAPPGMAPFRIAELVVGDVVLNVEANYDD